MATAAKKLGVTAAQKMLLVVLKAANGTKTTQEIAGMLKERTGKNVEKNSVTTAISVLRKTFKKSNIPFPESLEPKRASGGGRSSEREDIADVLNGLGIEFDAGEDDSETADAEQETADVQA